METIQEKGFKYEIQVRDYIINKLNTMAYLWSDIPETILINNGIIGSHNEHRLRRIYNKENSLQDTGIDIIQLDSNKKSSLVQCKNGYKKGITMNDLSGFMCWMAVMDKLNGYVYYTDKLSDPIRSLPKSPRIEYIKQKYIVEDNEKNNIIRIKPFDYQIKAKDEIIKYFQDNRRGILSMPCGTGKTYTSYLISQNYQQIIILSPLKQFAKQNLDRYIEYGYSGKSLLVDSDGERDINEIKKFITENINFLISTTFCSVDVISKCLELFDHDNSIFIIDEFHNLSKANVIDKNDDFNKILSNHNKQILFMSATPRVYEMEDLEDSNHDDLTEDESENLDEETNNNILSNDSDEINMFGNIVYNMTFTEAIEKKYITDYQIWLPSIHEDNDALNKELNIYQIDSIIKSKCNYLFSCLLNNGSKKCIVYCQDTKEISLMREAISKLNEYFYLEYEVNQITSIDSAKSRTDILEKFVTSNKIQLLFSVRILDECIDIPSCDSIYVTYPTKSKIRTIQRLSRCIRIDKKNPFKIGNIYIWCDEYDQILETLSGIKEYDLFFKDKIKINETNFFGDSKKDGIIIDVKLVEKFVMGIKELKMISWDEKLEWVKRYIDENGKRPSYNDDDKKIKLYGIWISNQQSRYIKNEHNMKIKDIRIKWEIFINDNKYKKYFLSNENLWINTLNIIKKYIDDNNKKPTEYDKNKNIKFLGKWLSSQQTSYKNNNNIMKNNKIKELWELFLNNQKYKKYFLSNEEYWLNKLNNVIKYIEEYKKRPSEDDKNKEINHLGKWLSHQNINYINSEFIFKNKEIKIKWETFINNPKYNKYFLSNEKYWTNTLDNIKKYMNDNNKRPSGSDKDKEIKSLATWISKQQINYINSKNIMKNSEIRIKWDEFISDPKYKKYFLSNEEEWINILESIKTYIDNNKKRPSSSDKNKDIKSYSNWLSNQQINYSNNENIMKNDEIKNKWKQFISDNKYIQYFLSNEDNWIHTLNIIKKYIDDNKKRPSCSDKNKEIRSYGQWLSNQKNNYIKKYQIMSNPTIRILWEEFINDNNYNQYF
jgi:superfamily II DNA or RNA helicase